MSRFKIKKSIDQFLIEKVLPSLGYWVITAIFSTIKIRWLHDKFLFDLTNSGKPVVFAFWHDQIAYMPYAYIHVVKKQNLVSLISKSKDGRIVGNIIKKFGLKSAYGSTSRGGKEALREIIRLIKEDNIDGAITPDGPRGPKYKLQPGIITLAQTTGTPIVSISFNVKTKIRLNSWDGFIVPLPFTYGYMAVGKPIYVPSDISEKQHKEFQKKLENKLISLSQEIKERLK